MDNDEHVPHEDLARAVEALADRVDRLTRRIESLERGRALGGFASPTAPSSTQDDPETRTTPTRKRVPEHLTPASSTPVCEPGQSGGTDDAGDKPVRQVPAPKPRVHAPKPPTKPLVTIESFEWVLGIKGLMLLGVVVVISGVGMFLKLAYDEGWIAALSPWTKCGSVALFGAILVALGELLRRKINPLASSGFGAAGIASMYASVYAAARTYGILSDEAAFSLMFSVTVLGVLLGAVGGRVYLSLLSLVGAFAVPVLLSRGEPSLVVFPAYMLLLLALGSSLSAWKGGRYTLARQLAWWGVGVMGSVWLVDMHDRSLVSSLVFVGAAWLMTITELACSARFFKLLRDSLEWDASKGAVFTTRDDGERIFNPASLLSREARWINALFGATLWAAVSAGLALRAHEPGLEYLAPLVLGAASVVILFVARRMGATPSFTPERGDASPLTLYLGALAINTGALAIAAIATGLGGWVQVLAWLTVGLAATQTARVLRFRAVGVFGGAMLVYAMARLVLYDLASWIDRDPSASLWGLALSPWSAQIVGAGIVFALASWRTRYAIERHLFAVLAFFAVALCAVHNATRSGSLGTAWALYAVLSVWAVRTIAPRVYQKSLRWATLLLLAIGSSIGLFAALIHDPGIEPIGPALIALAWAAWAAVPGIGLQQKVTGAAAAVLGALVSIGAVADAHSLELMIAIDAVFLAAVVALGAPLARWALGIIGGQLLPWAALALVGNTTLFTRGYLERAPFVGTDSIAAALLIGAMCFAAFDVKRHRVPEDATPTYPEFARGTRLLLLVTLWFMLLGTSTVEVLRTLSQFVDSGSARGAGLSIWWSVFAIVSVALGFRYPKPLRWGGLTLLCVVAAKVLILDTTTLSATARVVASISVGLIIITTAVLYTALVKRIEELERAQDDDTKPEDQSREPDAGSEDRDPNAY